MSKTHDFDLKINKIFQIDFESNKTLRTDSPGTGGKIAQAAKAAQNQRSTVDVSMIPGRV